MITTEKININRLKPAKYNPRVMPLAEHEKLKKGINTFGLVDPIIIDLKHDNTIIGGHQNKNIKSTTIFVINDYLYFTVKLHKSSVKFRKNRGGWFNLRMIDCKTDNYFHNRIW